MTHPTVTPKPILTMSHPHVDLVLNPIQFEYPAFEQAFFPFQLLYVEQYSF